MALRPAPLGAVVHQHLGYYVYGLMDPRSGRLFYVGRGQGDRILQHEWQALDGADRGAKLDLIREIQEHGSEVEKVIFRRQLGTQTACEVEAALIDVLLHFGSQFRGQIRGANAEIGLRSLSVIRLELAAPPLGPLPCPTLIVGINKTWQQDMSADELWEASRRWWGFRRNLPSMRPQLLLAVAQKIVRGAWVIDPDAPGVRETVTWAMQTEARKRAFYDDDEAEFTSFNGWSFDCLDPQPDWHRDCVGSKIDRLPQGGFTYR